jgi:triosephosphate isomerase
MFSGIAKAIDPLGSAYKFHDYFVAFNMTWLDFLSLPLGIFMCTAEFISGFAVISGIRKKEGMLGVSLLMIIFTPLTLILAITNPVTDCGCFGDAIHLTNWQTFWKNIILAILTVIVITGRKQFLPMLSTAKEWKFTGAIVTLFVLFCIGNLRYLPLIDFLPYKKDVRIADQMIIPEGAEPDKYLTTFIYEKNGEQKEFTLENYPADDTTWIFVDQKTTLLEQGYQPPIHDFAITTLDGIDITNQILADTGYTLLMISKKLEEADTVRLHNGFNTGQSVQSAGISFYVLTATSSDEILKHSNGLQFCTADETTLKTMLRSNPGYMLIHNGTIAGKWSTATLPETEWFKNAATGTETSQGNPARVLFVIFSILAALLTALLATAINIKKNFCRQP